MVLTRPSQVLAGAANLEPSIWDQSYQDNAELGESDTLGNGSCEAFRLTGRLGGYVTVWQREAAGLSVASQVHAFISEQGAADFLPWLATGVSQGKDFYFVNRGAVVTQVARRTLTDVGSDGAAYEVTLSSEGARMLWVGFRVGAIVASVSVAGPPTALEGVSSNTIGRVAVTQVLASPPTGSSYDTVLLQSVPVPQAQLGEQFASYVWDYCCSGSLDAEVLAESLANPMDATRRAAEGWLGTLMARYSERVGDGGTPVAAASSGLSVYRTAAGAARSRAASISRYLAGTASAERSTRFAVPDIPGATGLAQVIHDGDLTYQDTRVLLPVHGSVVLSATVRGDVGVDHRADVARIALLLHQRWHTVVPS